MEEVQENGIAGFWKRLIALFIDLLLLGGVGFVLGVFFESTFVEIDAWGKLIGFVIALGYFGVMNSQLAKGQTIGKRIVNIKVVDSENLSISLNKSLVRYSILSIPFFLNGTYFSAESDFSCLAYLLFPVFFGGMLAISYLYVFNRTTRQSLHDLAVGTYVINGEASSLAFNVVWKPHLALVATFFVIFAVAPVFMSGLFSDIVETQPFKDLAETQKILLNDEDVKNAAVTSGSTTFTSSEHGTSTITRTNAHIYLYANDVSNDALAVKFARIIMENYPEAKSKDSLNVTLTYGFDIGIWSQWFNQTHTFNPAEYAPLQQAEN